MFAQSSLSVLGLFFVKFSFLLEFTIHSCDLSAALVSGGYKHIAYGQFCPSVYTLMKNMLVLKTRQPIYKTARERQVLEPDWSKGVDQFNTVVRAL